MSCECERKKRMSELDKVRSLAKKAAMLDGQMLAIYKCADGTYGFGVESEGMEVVEYVTEY